MVIPIGDRGVTAGVVARSTCASGSLRGVIGQGCTFLPGLVSRRRGRGGIWAGTILDHVAFPISPDSMPLSLPCSVTCRGNMHLF